MSEKRYKIGPVPPKGKRRPSLHVLCKDKKESFVWWSQGKWVFWIGHDHKDRRTPQEAAKHGWIYVPAIAFT